MSDPPTHPKSTQNSLHPGRSTGRTTGPSPAVSRRSSHLDSGSEVMHELDDEPVDRPLSNRNGSSGDKLQSVLDAEFGPNRDRKKELHKWMNDNAGLLLIASAQLFFASMNASVKFLQSAKQGGGLPTLQLITIRMSCTYLGCLGYLLYSGDPNPILGPPEMRGLLALRGFVGFFGLAGMYQSLQHLSLSDATTLGFLGPTATGLLGYLVLKEPYTRREATAGLISLVGVILIARPAFIFGAESKSTGLPVSPDWGDEVASGSRTSWHGKVYDPDSGVLIKESTPQERLASVGFALMGVCGAAMAYVAVRAIGKRAKPFHSISYFSFYCVAVSVLGMAIFRTPLVFPRTVVGWGLIAIIGMFGLAAQILLTMGLQREKAGRGALAMYTQLLFATVIERILFHVSPSFLSILGTIIIIGSTIWVVFAKQAPVTKDPEAVIPDLSSSSALNRISGSRAETALDATHQIPLSQLSNSEASRQKRG